MEIKSILLKVEEKTSENLIEETSIREEKKSTKPKNKKTLLEVIEEENEE